MCVNSNIDKQKHVLVMGGLGFIGSHLSRLLCQEGYQVRIFDKLYGSRNLIADIEDKVEVIEGDAERTEDILRAQEKIDITIDLIHSTVPGLSMVDSVYDVQSNIISHVSWLSNLKKTALKKIIYISSGGTVYGIPKNTPITEDHPTNPISSYGITKLTIEKYVAMYAKIQGIDYHICRPSNVYGEGQHLHLGQGAIGVFVESVLKGKTIEIWGDGSVKRDYLYVADMVQSIAELIEYQGEEKIFNISSCVGHSLTDILEIIRQELNTDIKIHYKPSRTFDVPINVLDNSKLRSETGWFPRTDLVTGVRHVCNYLANI